MHVAVIRVVSYSDEHNKNKTSKNSDDDEKKKKNIENSENTTRVA